MDLPECKEQAYFSKFGGLWTDRKDFLLRLQQKLDATELTDDEALDVMSYVANGYVVFRSAVDPEDCDDYVRSFDRIFRSSPPTLWVIEKGKVAPFNPRQYNEVVKYSDFHYYYPNAERLIFPPRLKRFLEIIYERPPVVFQTMTTRLGTQEMLHTDTGPLTLTEPMSLAAGWLALEDVRPGSGEFQFVPRSHRVPEQLINGKTKGHGGDMNAYGLALNAILAECKARHYEMETFLAKKGDVLLWAADLMHGGLPILDRSLTRRSLISHFMPYGVMPTFYDASGVNCLPYPNGAYYLDRFDPRDIAAYNQQLETPPASRFKLPFLKFN